MKKIFYWIITIILLFAYCFTIAEDNISKTTPPEKWILWANFDTQWTKWYRKDYDPILVLLDTQAAMPSSYLKTFESKVMDVNWDWLPDMIVFKRFNYLMYNKTARIFNFVWLMLNKGNMDYEITYRCVYPEYDNVTDYYYWDCVQ